MAKKLNLVLATLIGFLALSSAAEHQQNDVSTGDLPVESVPTFNPLIELPRDNQETAVVSELPASTESTDDQLTTVAFLHEDRSLDGPRGKRLRHGHGHFKPEEMSFGNDMILSSHHDEGSDDVEEKPERWVKFHHQGEHEFGDSNGNDDVRRPDHHRHNHRRFEREGDDERENHRDHHHRHGRFDRDDDEEREGRGQRFDREDDEEREGRHHHHHHHHHHHDGEEQDEEGGVVMKMRKFLMGRF